MSTQSLASVTAHVSAVVDSVHETHERVTVTKNGVPTVVVVAVEYLESLEETLAILADEDTSRCRPRWMASGVPAAGSTGSSARSTPPPIDVGLSAHPAQGSSAGTLASARSRAQGDIVLLAASLGEDGGVAVVADVAVGRRPRPGGRGGALVVVLAA